MACSYYIHTYNIHTYIQSSHACHARNRRKPRSTGNETPVCGSSRHKPRFTTVVQLSTGTRGGFLLCTTSPYSSTHRPPVGPILLARVFGISAVRNCRNPRDFSPGPALAKEKIRWQNYQGHGQFPGVPLKASISNVTQNTQLSPYRTVQYIQLPHSARDAAPGISNFPPSFCPALAPTT